MAASPHTTTVDLTRAAEEAVEATLVGEGRAHVDKLRAVLTLHGLYEADGLALSSTPAAARLLHPSEWRAGRLLDEAMLLTTLSGALDAIAAGVLTVEQSSVVVTQLRQVADLERRLQLWRRLVERLRRPEGAALPPARLKEVLQRWIAILTRPMLSSAVSARRRSGGWTTAAARTV